MEPDPNAPRKKRETFLMLILTIGFASSVLFFLVLVSGGFFVYVLASVFAIALVGLLHYALWGHALTQEVAGEREEEESRARWEAEQGGRFWERPPRE